MKYQTLLTQAWQDLRRSGASWRFVFLSPLLTLPVIAVYILGFAGFVLLLQISPILAGVVLLCAVVLTIAGALVSGSFLSGGLAFLAEKVRDGGRPTFREGLDAGGRTLGPLVRLQIRLMPVWFVIFGVYFGLVFGVWGLSYFVLPRDQPPMAVFLVLPVALAWMMATTWLGTVLADLAMRRLVVGGRSPADAFRWGWRMLRRRFRVSAPYAAIVYLINYAYTSLTMPIAIVPMYAIMGLSLFTLAPGATSTKGVPWLFLALMLFAVLVTYALIFLLLVPGMVFYYAAWSRVYCALEDEDVGMSEAPAAAGPGPSDA